MSQLTAIAHQKFIRQSPRKLRLVADTVRGLSVSKALTQLEYTPKRAAVIIQKVVKQAAANATDGKGIKDNMKINKIEIQEASRLKRWRPVSRGRAHPIIKRMSHIKIEVTGTKPNQEDSPTKTKTTKKNTK